MVPDLSSYELILGSRSPRRSELLSSVGLKFAVDPTDANEDFDASLSPGKIAEQLARKKAEAYRTLQGYEIYITCDTLVYANGVVLNKPADAAEARSMLRSLSGRSHEVYSGMCLRDDTRTHVFHESTEVHFRELSDEWIEYYIHQYKPFDKAGAYGIQEWIGMMGIERINGCFYNVMGLPVSRFMHELVQFCAR